MKRHLAGVVELPVSILLLVAVGIAVFSGVSVLVDLSREHAVHSRDDWHSSYLDLTNSISLHCVSYPDGSGVCGPGSFRTTTTAAK